MRWKKHHKAKQKEEELGNSLIPNLRNLKQPTPRPHIRLPNILDPIHNRRARRERNAVVVGLADAADGGDVVLDEDVLG